MKTYNITITETLEMTVPIQAENLAKAEKIAEKIGRTASIFWMQSILQESVSRRRNLEKRGKMNGKKEKNTREAAK